MFKNLRLRPKILLSFSVVLVLMLISSGLAYKQFVTVGHEIDEFAAIVDEASSISHIETLFLKLRGHAREFANTAHENDAKAVHVIGTQLVKELNHSLSLAQNPEHKVILAKMKLDVESYILDFSKAEKLEHHFLNLIKDELVPEGEKMTDDIDKMLEEVIARDGNEIRTHIERIQKHALLARLYSNVLIGHSDASVEQNMHHEFKLLHESVQKLSKIANTDLEKRLAAEVNQLAIHYEKTVGIIHHEEIELRELVDGEMSSFAKDLVQEAEHLQALAAKEEEAIRHETVGNIETSELELIIVGLTCFVTGGLLAWLLSGAIEKPVKAMTGVMQELAKNNLGVFVPYTTNKDELGEMADSVNHFKNQMSEVQRLEQEQEEQKLQADAQRRVAMMQMADIFENSVGKVVDTVTSAATELQATSTQMSTTAHETSEQATAVATASVQASANVQTVASATEELTSSNQEIGRNVEESSKVSSDAALKAQNTQSTVASLVEEVSKISNFAKTINDIAEQTNMLALNATIESARAGETGKGFAVVASEVKTLAEQTAKATHEIVRQIEQVTKVTEKASTAMQEIGKSISAADHIASSVAAAIEEQMVATEEIARSVEQAAKGTEEVTVNIQKVEQASGETGSSAGQIASASSDLSKQAEYLKEEVAKFLHQVRAGDDDKKLLEWTTDLETNIGMIDQGHRSFFDEINHYHGQMLSGLDRTQVEKTLTKVMMIFDQHCILEEKEMTKSGYPQLKAHIPVHREMTEKLKSLKDQFDQGDDVSLDFFDSLARFLIDHTGHLDKAFAEYLQNEHPEMLETQAA